jgi:hypothetical protein
LLRQPPPARPLDEHSIIERLKELSRLAIAEVQQSFSLPPHAHEDYRLELRITAELTDALEEMAARMYAKLGESGVDLRAVASAQLDLGNLGVDLVDDETLKVAIGYARIAHMVDPTPQLRSRAVRASLPISVPSAAKISWRRHECAHSRAVANGARAPLPPVGGGGGGEHEDENFVMEAPPGGQRRKEAGGAAGGGPAHWRVELESKADVVALVDR